MAMDSSVVIRLELIASKAKLLAMKESDGQHWDGELRKGVAELHREIEELSRDTQRR